MLDDKMMPSSRFKIRNKERNSNDMSESNNRLIRFKTEDEMEARNSIDTRYSISGNLKSKQIPVNLLDDLLRQGSVERNRVFRDLTSSIKDRSAMRPSYRKSMLKTGEQ